MEFACRVRWERDPSGCRLGSRVPAEEFAAEGAEVTVLRNRVCLLPCLSAVLVPFSVVWWVAVWLLEDVLVRGGIGLEILGRQLVLSCCCGLPWMLVMPRGWLNPFCDTVVAMRAFTPCLDWPHGHQPKSNRQILYQPTINNTTSHIRHHVFSLLD